MGRGFYLESNSKFLEVFKLVETGEMIRLDLRFEEIILIVVSGVNWRLVKVRIGGFCWEVRV